MEIKYKVSVHGHHPDTADAQVSDPDSSRFLQPLVGDGVNNSQVPLHAGEDVEHGLADRHGPQGGYTHCEQLWKVHEFGVQKDADGHQFTQQHGDGVIGDDVRVTGCRGEGGPFPTLLDAQVDDEDEEREEEEVGHGCNGKDIEASSGTVE